MQCIVELKMANGSTPLKVEAPLYVRWGADRSPYAIELKLELIGRLRLVLESTLQSGMEVGGVLMGTLPTMQSPTLRIEEVEMLSRRAEDGATFMLEGGGGERFAEARRRAKLNGRAVVGMFRSHRRPGLLRPSLADRTLLASEFKEPVYALLLLQGESPFSAAFFVASNGPLPAETSVREFRLDESEFKTLPELQPEYSAEAPLPTPSRSSGWAGALALLAIAALVFATIWYFNRSLFPMFGSSPNTLQLSVKKESGDLRISWNHRAQDLDHATGATLTIVAGPDHREIALGPDDLRLGAVQYENTGRKAEVTLALNTPGSLATSQSVVWGE